MSYRWKGRTRSSSAFVKYPKEFDFNGLKVLNLGCGYAQFQASNVVNLDGEACSNADVIHDLSKTPLPFKDETFDHILANHILEHVPNWWECFKDCSRILKIGGVLELWVPGPGGDSLLGYRDHINVINHYSFSGIGDFARNPGNAWEVANIDNRAAQLKLFDQTLNMEDYWWLRIGPGWWRAWCAVHLRNVIYEVGFKFRKLPAPVQAVLPQMDDRRTAETKDVPLNIGGK